MSEDELMVQLLQLQVAEIKKERDNLKTELAEAKAKMEAAIQQRDSLYKRADKAEQQLAAERAKLEEPAPKAAAICQILESQLVAWRDRGINLDDLQTAIRQEFYHIHQLERELYSERAAHEETKRAMENCRQEWMSAVDSDKQAIDQLRARVEELEKERDAYREGCESAKRGANEWQGKWELNQTEKINLRSALAQAQAESAGWKQCAESWELTSGEWEENCKNKVAALAKAEADTKRLDWLADNWEMVYQRVQAPGWWYFDPVDSRTKVQDTLRSAIDAALAQKDQP